MKSSFAVRWLCGLAAIFLQAGLLIAEPPASFVQQIRPLLSDKCFACHGPDENTREADLRLDMREQAIEHGALTPGQADQSELLRRVLSEDPDERMPPEHVRKDLTPEEIELLRRWINEGAPYQTHWAYRPLVRPPVPASKDPRIKGAIDAFLLDRLSPRNLDLSPAADKITLVRRLYLDLLGVPPTPAEVAEFVNDDSPQAIEKLVDRLLRDQKFGERMAVYWLDLVRYADTIGYHSDNAMEVSAYRDYVIEAFNNNKPFDQFTIEQLAGDLLPEATETQRVASGYNRLLQTTEEGGAQAKEYIAIYAADRVRNVSGVWLGATVGCAQCHDHKYDPITTRDFYSLAAFFADVKEKPIGKRQPNLKLYRDADRAKIKSMREEIAGLRIPRLLETDSQLAADVAAGQRKWEAQSLARAAAGAAIWNSPEPVEVSADRGVVLQRQEDGSYVSTAGNPDRGTYTYKLTSAANVRSIQLEVFPTDGFPGAGFARGNGNFVLTGFKVSAGDKPLEIAAAKADYQQNGWPVAHVIDRSSTSGWAIDGHHKKAAQYTAWFELKQPLEPAGDDVVLTIELSHQSVHAKHLIGRFRISVSDQAVAGQGGQPLSEELLTAMRTEPEKRSEAQLKLLAEKYQSISPELEPWKKKLADTEKALQDFEARIRSMLVTESLAQPRMTRILPRGNWLDDSGEVVQPAVPEFLPHTKVEGRRATRLDLAKWLMEDTNPLTARTFVNRLWKIFFGRGLSRNLDDLGGQGQPPTHPELLDWLAVEFRESGWDVKHMVRLLATSSAYAQSSVGSPELRRLDPDNRWYARQGRWRLEAEFVRDTALKISGLLADDQVGGVSVKPFQPAGYWQHLNFPTRQWKAGQGNDLYRRGLYTFWCRTFLHPAMLAFDASSREECMAERARSNIPQQALVLLNDPTFLEASRVFAQRIWEEKTTPPEQIRWAFREALSRPASDRELALLHTLYQEQLERYQSAPKDAEALIQVGAAPVPEGVPPAQLAAWTQVARAIINLYETTSRF